MEGQVNLGEKLKELRRAKKMTLNELAEKTGFSAAYLSNIERNATSPTINNLFKISTALDAEIIDIMSDASVTKSSLILRKEERENIFNQKQGIIYENITDPRHDVKGTCVTIDADCYDEVLSTGHSLYGELGIQIEGSIDIWVENEITETLKPGDTVYIPQNKTHRYKKNGPGKSITYWVHHEKGNGLKK